MLNRLPCESGFLTIRDNQEKVGHSREKGQRSKNWQQSRTLSKIEQALTKNTAGQSMRELLS